MSCSSTKQAAKPLDTQRKQLDVIAMVRNEVKTELSTSGVLQDQALYAKKRGEDNNFQRNRSLDVIAMVRRQVEKDLSEVFPSSAAGRLHK